MTNNLTGATSEIYIYNEFVKNVNNLDVRCGCFAILTQDDFLTLLPKILAKGSGYKVRVQMDAILTNGVILVYVQVDRNY